MLQRRVVTIGGNQFFARFLPAVSASKLVAALNPNVTTAVTPTMARLRILRAPCLLVGRSATMIPPRKAEHRARPSPSRARHAGLLCEVQKQTWPAGAQLPFAIRPS